MNKLNLTNISTRPGCYLFKNQTGKIIYIGKAKNIKQRVRSYFNQKNTLSPMKKLMVAEIKTIETIVVNNETEALLLENNLIKKFQPKYNIDLKDDKNFCYVKITKQKLPNISVERQIKPDKALYFGPFLSAKAVRQTLALFWQKGPATFKKSVNQKEYLKTVEQIKNFFRGHTTSIIKQLKKQMSQAASQKNYELASIYRDRLQAIEKISQQQKIVSTKMTNQDVFSLFTWNNLHAVNLFRIRQGKIIDKLNFTIGSQINEPKHILLEFIQTYYTQTNDWPNIIITNLKLYKNELSLGNKKIKIKQGNTGRLKKILDLGELNAQDYLAKKIPSFYRTEKDLLQATVALANQLRLNSLPQRIECYDISNFQGNFAVGAMVVFINGSPAKSEYRKFKIKYTQGINDYAMMSEIIARRFRGHTNWAWPDLIIIDGGKGQLSSVKKTLQQLKIKLPIIALAKKNEEIFLPDEKSSIRLTQHSPALKLIQNIRDEAHRFAINYYRQTHLRNNLG